jgi:antitoxin YefM
MIVINFTEARKSLRSVLDRVVEDADCTVIARRDAEDAVVMSVNHYNALMETVHLLKSPANAARLAQSISEHQNGRTVIRETLTTDE